MKQTKFFIIILFSITLLIASCKKDSENTSNNNNTVVVLTTFDTLSVSIHSASCTIDVQTPQNTQIIERGLYAYTDLYFDTLNAIKVVQNNVVGKITTIINALPKNTEIKIKGFAKTSLGLFWGNETTLQTADSMPNITTNVDTFHTTNTKTILGLSFNGLGFSRSAWGVCWGTTPNLTINSINRIESRDLSKYDTLLSNLNPNTTYYARAYVKNYYGTLMYADVISFKTQQFNYTLGQHFGGGVIFYLTSNEAHGLIADTGDLVNPSTNLPLFSWQENCGQYSPYQYFPTRTYANGYFLGTGASNTSKICNVLGSNGNYAAKACKSSSRGGFNDWYLPSRDELDILFHKKDIVGGFKSTDWYWSSSEDYDISTNINHAYYQKFDYGYSWFLEKFAVCNVRAIRTF